MTTRILYCPFFWVNKHSGKLDELSKTTQQAEDVHMKLYVSLTSEPLLILSYTTRWGINKQIL